MSAELVGKILADPQWTEKVVVTAALCGDLLNDVTDEDRDAAVVVVRAVLNTALGYEGS